jgi:hypothetical protein
VGFCRLYSPAGNDIHDSGHAALGMVILGPNSKVRKLKSEETWNGSLLWFLDLADNFKLDCACPSCLPFRGRGSVVSGE